MRGGQGTLGDQSAEPIVARRRRPGGDAAVIAGRGRVVASAGAPGIMVTWMELGSLGLIGRHGLDGTATALAAEPPRDQAGYAVRLAVTGQHAHTVVNQYLRHDLFRHPHASRAEDWLSGSDLIWPLNQSRPRDLRRGRCDWQLKVRPYCCPLAISEKSVLV